MNNRKITFHSFGDPENVLSLANEDGHNAPPSPGPEELVLEILYAPINPADINYAEGNYGTRPDLPATPGHEASARVIGVGAALRDAGAFQEGDLVILTKRRGSWRDQLLVPAADVLKINPGIDPQQAAMLAVNPPTAWLLLHEFIRDLQPGEWIAQNAANSGVGRAVIQIARALGWRTLNFVRRESLFTELRDLGADAVFLDSPDGLNEARELIKDTQPRLALNAVGGDSALRLMDLAAPAGIHVTYGAMSRRSLKVPNGFLIFKDIQLRGFWVTRWLDAAPPEVVASIFARLGELMREGHLVLPIEKVYPPEEITAAIRHAKTEQRGGKVLLDFTG